MTGGRQPRRSFPTQIGVAVDASGNVLIADYLDGTIRTVAGATGTFYGQSMTKGDIYTIAGGGSSGLGDGGPATSAQLDEPYGVAVDASGNVLIADFGHSRIRAVAYATGAFYGQSMTKGDIYTIAGGGSSGLGDGGPATSAEVPANSIAVDGSGNVLIGDTNDSRVRVVATATGTFYSQSMTKGDIYTIAGSGSYGYSGDGGPATSAQFYYLDGVAVDASGNVLIADENNNRVRVMAVATGTFYGQSMTKGDIYTMAGNGSSGYSGDGASSTSAELNGPLGVAVDASGNVLVTDAGNDRVRVTAGATGTFYGKSMTKGDIYTMAGNGTYGYSGDGGPATSAELNGPFGVAVDASNNVLVTDAGNSRVRVAAGATGTFYGQSMTKGDIYTIAGDGTSGYSGDGGLSTSAELDGPAGIAVDTSGNVLIGDSGDNRVRVVAIATGTFYGQSMTKGDIYTIAGDGTLGYSGDGGPATSAELDGPFGVSLDASGNVVIADEGNSRVRVVAIATGTFYGQSMTKGDIYTIAGDGTSGYSGDGGLSTSAELKGPEGVAVDASGNVVIADSLNYRIRVVAKDTGTFYGISMTAGDIYTVAGNGSCYEVCLPEGVTVDASGNIVEADTYSYRVQVIPGSNGTYYGDSMTTGNIYTVAGLYTTYGFSGDGGPASSALLDFPEGVVVDASGDVLIADHGNNRIREIGAYGTQAITFTSTQPSGAFNGGPAYSASATGGASGNPVTFSSATPGVCSVSGSTVSFVGAGTCTVDANQAGNADYDSAPQISQSFSVAQASQTVTFTSTNPSPVVASGPSYTPTASGGGSTSPVAISLDTGSTGCTLNGGVVQFTAAGTCILDANQAGDANYLPALQVQQAISVAAQCSPGYYSTTGGVPCTAAPAGSYVSTSGATSATSCAAGTYSSSSGATSCTPAPAGSYVSTTGATSASLSAVGYFSSTSGSSTCTAAPAGSYVSSPGAISASSCAAGAYQPNSGQSACFAADPGSFVATTGAVSESACTVGTYQPNSGQSSCLAADPGSFVATTGATSESPCSAGTFQPNSGRSSCLSADPGDAVASTGATSESPCALGTYQPDSGQPACLPADPGSYVGTAGAISESPCALGSYNSLSGQSSCTAAPAGTYVDTTGASAPVDCGVGTFNPSTGQSSCTDAPSGSYVDSTGAISATLCSTGTYSESSGASSCTPASPGTYVDTTGAIAANDCALGTYQPDSGQTSCISAPPNTYVDTTGATAATPCPAGTYNPNSGSTSSAACIPVPFGIATTSLPNATPGTKYLPTVTLQADGIGTSAPGYTTTLKWAKVSLPKGMKLSSSGVLSGTPSKTLAAGPSSVTVKVTETVTTLNGTKKVKTKTTAEATIPLAIT